MLDIVPDSTIIATALLFCMRRQNRPINLKCFNCGIDSTPLWRKVPNKEEEYYWYHLLLVPYLTR